VGRRLALFIFRYALHVGFNFTYNFSINIFKLNAQGYAVAVPGDVLDEAGAVLVLFNPKKGRGKCEGVAGL